MAASRIAKLVELGITLPKLTKPVASYVPFVLDNNGLLWVSGQLPMADGKLLMTGQVTDESVPDAAAAARQCAINALAVIDEAVGLDRVDRVIKVSGFVKGAHTFNSPHLVINGCSNLLGEVFGSAHARSAVVVSSLPLDAAVEIEFIVQVNPQ